MNVEPFTNAANEPTVFVLAQQWAWYHHLLVI